MSCNFAVLYNGEANNYAEKKSELMLFLKSEYSGLSPPFLSVGRSNSFHAIGDPMYLYKL